MLPRLNSVDMVDVVVGKAGRYSGERGRNGREVRVGEGSAKVRLSFTSSSLKGQGAEMLFGGGDYGKRRGFDDWEQTQDLACSRRNCCVSGG